MVEQSLILDSIFKSLADATRRDILRRVAQSEYTISALAESYKMSFAGIAKHIAVLEAAALVVKRKEGREQIVSANPKTIAVATTYLQQYKELWEGRYDSLDAYLK